MKLIEDGREPHPAFFQQPEISEFNAFYWEAFQDLSSERQIGMGIGPIPRSAVMSYAAECNLYGDAAEYLYDVIRKVDTEFLRQANSVSKDTPDTSVSVRDLQGTKQVMERLAARAKSATKPQPMKRKGNGES